MYQHKVNIISKSCTEMLNLSVTLSIKQVRVVEGYNELTLAHKSHTYTVWCIESRNIEFTCKIFLCCTIKYTSGVMSLCTMCGHWIMQT